MSCQTPPALYSVTKRNLHLKSEPTSVMELLQPNSHGQVSSFKSNPTSPMEFLQTQVAEVRPLHRHRTRMQKRALEIRMQTHVIENPNAGYHGLDGFNASYHGSRFRAWCPPADLAESSRFFGEASFRGQVCEVELKGVRGSRAYIIHSVVCDGEGDPVITESTVLSMEEDVRVILEDSGLLPFFKKFTGHNEAITKQFMESWKNGRVTINGLDIDINEGLIVEVACLPNDGELISRDKMDQGLMKLIVEHNSKRHGSPVGPSRGAANRVSGVPITKYQRLIGSAPPSLHLTSIDSESDADDDFESQGMVSPVTIPKEKEGKKRKLSDNLAKSSRRSIRLQRKSAGKSNVIVDEGSSEEEQKTDTAQGKVGRSSHSKSAATNPSEKGEGSPDDSQHPSEDLLGHLRIFNILSGTLMSTCACLNLLIVEITNYLKEAAKGKKD
eukprot:Gb_11350 [translate_table: standard]